MTSSLGAGAWSLGLLLAGCGGSLAGAAPDAGSEHGYGVCSPSPGTYTEHFTAESAGTSCPKTPPADQTLTIDESGTVAGRDAGPDDSGGIAGCSTTEDTATCTFTTDCGGAGVISTTITFDGDVATGTRTLPNGCAYGVSVTKN